MASPSSTGVPPGPLQQWVRWCGLALCLLGFHLSNPLVWSPTPDWLWYPPAGLGFALAAWFGPRGVLLAGADVFLIAATNGHAHAQALPAYADAALAVLELGLGWWSYRVLCGGHRRVDDPASGIAFFLLVPGVAAAAAAVLRAWLSGAAPLGPEAFSAWVRRAVGVVSVAPAVLAALTPPLARAGLIPPDPREDGAWADAEPWGWGDAIEVGGLCAGAAVLGALLGESHAAAGDVNWHLWAVLLLVVVWAGLRQGLPGGAAAACSAAALALWAAGAAPDPLPPALVSLQGNLLALGGAALLVGSSSGWLRASEMRYRQVVGHMPVVLYSARAARPRAAAPGEAHGRGKAGGPDARVLLVSPAARDILGCAPAELTGDYAHWLRRVHPEDRELLLAAVAQLHRSRQPVTCEYRLDPALPPRPADDPGPRPDPAERWVRETLAPNYDKQGRLRGWEGVVEDITARRALAHGLQRTTNMLQALVANLPAGVFFVQGPGGQPTLVNARARQLLGQREDPSAGVAHMPRVYRLHGPDGAPYPAEELPVYRALHLGLTSMRDDIIVHRPDGRRVPLIAWAAPIDLGHPRGALAAVWVFEDLTGLHQAEAARIESEARLRAVIEAMAEGLVVQDQQGRIIECNPAACQILAAPAAELVGRPSLAGGRPCLREDGTPFPAAEHPDAVCVAGREPVRNVLMGLPVAAPDPSAAAGVRWVLVNCVPVTAGQVGRAGFTFRVISTFADVTDYRRTLSVLRASEEKYRGLVETLPLMVFQLDPGGQVTYGNPAAREVLPGGGGAGRLLDFVAAEDRPAAAAAIDRALAGSPGQAEFRLADGRHCYAFALPLRHDAAGAGCTLVAVDLTLQRRLEAEVGRVQRLELIGRIAGGIVHDFNNLLTPILTLAQLAQRKGPGDPSVREDLRTIAGAAEEAARLAAQLLTFSKQKAALPRPVRLNRVVERTLEMLRGNLPRSVAVEADLADAPPPVVLADEGQLQQVAMNLCLNARDAMPGGGRLAVRTRTGVPPDGADGADGGGWGCLEVEDTGVGIDEPTREKVFDPFFSTKERGTGLGLTVVRQVVEGFRGRIHLESTPGRGTRVEVWLPLAPDG